MVLLLGVLCIWVESYAINVPTDIQPEGDFQVLIYLLFVFLGWLAWLGHNVWIQNKSKKENPNKTFKAIEKMFDDREDKVIQELHLFEVKFEGMMATVKTQVLGDNKVLENKIDSVQKELTEFKIEVRNK